MKDFNRVMHRAGLVLAVAGSCILAACSGNGAMRCEDQGNYTASRSAPPLRVPEDLSLPNENDALQVPPDDGDAGDEEGQTECLERPPDYFEGGRPQSAQ